MTIYRVTALWDPEAGVFTSESDIPGLVVEAESFEEFVELVEALGPEMLEANVPDARRPYAIEVLSQRLLSVA